MTIEPIHRATSCLRGRSSRMKHGKTEKQNTKC